MSVGNASVRTEGPFFRWLDGVWGRRALRGPEGYPCEFTLGWLGYLGYELKRETGGSDVTAETPDACLLFAGRAVVLDHVERTVWLLALDAADAGDWLAAARAAVAAGRPRQRRHRRTAAAAPSRRHPAPSRPAGLHRRDSEVAYKAKITEAQYEIAEGNTYEVCLTTALTAEFPARPLDPRQAYLALRRRNPAPFASYLRFGDLTVASTSPERFLRIAADGGMRAEPIKGTRHRDADPARDAQLRQDLESSPEGPGREHHDRGPAAQRPQPFRRARLGVGQPALRDRKLRHGPPDGEHHRCPAQARACRGPRPSRRASPPAP